MNDFNQFLNLLRNQQTENENTPAEQQKDESAKKTERPVVPMHGDLAKPISADMSEFMESVQTVSATAAVPSDANEWNVQRKQPQVTPAVEKEEPTVAENNAEQPRVNAVADDKTKKLEAVATAAEAPVSDKTRVVDDIAQVPISTEEHPAKGSVSAEKTTVVSEKTKAIRLDPAELTDIQPFAHISVQPVSVSENPAAALGQQPHEKTKYIDGKGNLLRAIAKTARESDQAEGQIMMEGFDANDPVPTDEQTMEEELRSVREKRIEEFGLPKEPVSEDLPEHSEPPKTGTIPLPSFLTAFAEKFADRETPFAPVNAEEYRMHEDRRRVSMQLRDSVRKTCVKAGVQFGLGLILLLTNLITTVSANANNGFFTVFGANVTAYAVFNLVFFIASAVLLIPDFKNAVITVLKLRARTEAALLGMYLAVFVQTVALFFTELQPEHDYHLFTGACVLLGALYTASKIFWLKNTRYCFKQASVTENKLYLRSIRDPKALRTLLCENNVDGVCVDFSLKTKFVSDFLKRSSDAARSAMPRSIVVPALSVVCVLCGIIAAAVQGSPVCGLSAVAGAACLSFPVCGVAVSSLLLCDINRMLSDKKACIGSLRDARNVVTADHLAFGGKDLFRVKLVKTATVDGVSEKAAARTAAMLAKKAGDTMAAAFSPVLADYDKRLPDVEEFAVEEKLGVSAWVDNCRVLLGSAQMLINHNIQPGKVEDTAENEHHLYLAIEGNAVAVFTLQYICRENLSHSLNAVSQTGVNLFIRTADPNLTAEMIRNAASLPENSVRIVPKSGTELFDRLYETVSDRENAGLLGAGGFQSLCDAVGEAVKLDRLGRMISYICTASSVVGACAALLLCTTGSIGKASGWSAVFLQIIWNAAAFLLPQLLYKLSGLKKNIRSRKKKPQKKEQTQSPAVAAEDGKPTAEQHEQLNFVLANGFAEEAVQTDEE